jgi:hypothetical protein
MTAPLLAFALVLPAAAAWSVISRLDPEPARGPIALALRTGASCVLGAGFASTVTYAWLVGGGTLGPRYALFDAVFFLAIAVLGRQRREPLRAGPPPPLSPVEAIALGLTAAGVLLLAAALIDRASAIPHGEWDAWAIWNDRARFLSRGGAEWRAAFVVTSHPEYPLLVPLAVARLWTFAGETTAAPIATAVVFSLAPVLVLVGAVGRRSGAVAGASAGLLLAATGSWLHWGVAQYADVPLAALVAAAVALLLDADAQAPRRRNSLALAGACLGFCAWTKEDGILFAGVFLAWTAVRGSRALGTSRVRSSLGRLGALAAGAALPALARVHFQLFLSPGFAWDFTTNQTLGTTLERILDPERWRTIVSALPPLFPGFAWALPLVAVAVAALLGARPRDVIRSPVLIPVLAVYAAYSLVYAGTPLPLEWHIGTSAERVLLQAWPALLIAVLALVPQAPPAGAATAQFPRDSSGATA